MVDARPGRLKAWRKAAERLGGPEHGILLTDSGGPLHGPLAHGLALGAHLAVTNGLIWNRLGAAYGDYAADRARLRRPWGIQHRAEYRDRLASLMKNQLVGRVQEAVLRTRHTLAVRTGRTPAREEWAEAVGRAFTARNAGDRALAERSLHHIALYEDKLRADGALAPDGRVDTLAAFDLGRAVNVVRLALGARYTDPYEAEQDVLRLGELAQSAYSSWPDFSLGYLMARLVHRAEDDGPEAAEATYQQSFAEHRTLTQDPAGPYRNLPGREPHEPEPDSGPSRRSAAPGAPASSPRAPAPGSRRPRPSSSSTRPHCVATYGVNWPRWPGPSCTSRLRAPRWTPIRTP